MRIKVDETQQLLKRVRDATRINFHLACADLFAYLDERIPDNSELIRLQQERREKWSSFGREGAYRWKMPIAKEDRSSLAHDLFRKVAETGDEGKGLLFHLYHKNFDENVNAFRSDFLQYLVDAINRIGKSEPTEVAETSHRAKQQKFGILDAPNLLATDLEGAPGMFGRALIYFDLDNFKLVNTKFSERLVDETVLPTVQRLVAAAVVNQGYAYAEGGDEMIVLLPNATLSMGAEFADALRDALSRCLIDVHGEMIQLTASFGVAADTGGPHLADNANLAKNFAKSHGKNCVAVHREGQFGIWQGLRVLAVAN